MDLQKNLEATANIAPKPYAPTMAMLTSQLAVAQQGLKKAKTPVEIINAQEVVDAIADRIDLQEWLATPEPATIKLTKDITPPAPKDAAMDEAIMQRLKKLIGTPFSIPSQSWKQVEIHEN